MSSVCVWVQEEWFYFFIFLRTKKERKFCLFCSLNLIVSNFFFFRGKYVVAIDIDPNKIGFAYHNASIYGVVDQIDFIQGDFFILSQTLKV